MCNLLNMYYFFLVIKFNLMILSMMWRIVQIKVDNILQDLHLQLRVIPVS